MRDGVREHISKHDIVVGDIVYLSAGDIIPADGVIFQKVPASCAT
jgi:P-type E1-E2 ATPase